MVSTFQLPGKTHLKEKVKVFLEPDRKCGDYGSFPGGLAEFSFPTNIISEVSFDA